ncbi:MAG: hypothetical protein NC408_02955 [Candidatus Gastranaerophilales bacterium]|nr:hypothetical protein [Candidatus Gastranaerophilales bacterium]MCM1073386.1 hypothetical protein [Bacteroides sp.]
MFKKDILKWVTIVIAAFLWILFTFPVSSLHCDKSADVCTVTTRALFSSEKSAEVVARFNISKIESTDVGTQGGGYHPILTDKDRETYILEVFPTKTKQGSEDIIKHILNDDKYDIEGSFFKIINKGY